MTQSARVSVEEYAQAPDRWDRRDCPVVERKGKPGGWLGSVPGARSNDGNRFDGPLENHPDASFKLDYRVNGVRKGPTVLFVLAQIGLTGITQLNLTAREIDIAIDSGERQQF